MAKNILLVEDDDASQMLMKQAMKMAGKDYILNIASNGEEAIDFLNHCGNRQPLPDLMLLDLNLPGKNGLEILKEIRDTSAYKEIPVLILTGSNATNDRQACSKFDRCQYVLKPSRFHDLVEFVKTFETLKV